MKEMDMIKDIVRVYRNYPDHVAFVIDDTSYTYQEVFARVQGIMPFVQDCPEDIIGIIAEDCIETYASILAVLLSGKTYVILHPNYPDSRNRTIVESTGMKRVLYGHASGTQQGLSNEIKCISTLELRDENIDHLTGEQTQDTNKNAYIIFTSGSTGVPKGVPISRKNLNAFYAAYHQLGWQLGPTDRMLQMFELTFDVSVVSTLYPLTLGASIYTVGTNKLKYMRVYELMEDEELTFVAMPPSLLQFLSPYFGEIHVPKLKYLIVTAEAANADLLQRFRACAPNAEFVNLYGPTEATIYCTAYRIPPEGCKQHNGMIAIGHPFTGIDTMIMDEKGIPVQTGEQGELWVSGKQVMRGYWQDEEKSRQVFAQFNGKEYYKTGDLCSIDPDGDIIYRGRKDYQVKVQGFRVELSEIEYRTKKFFPNETNAVVVPKKEDDGGCQLHLFVGTTPHERETLLHYLKEHLPVYMLPTEVHFLEEFPLNTSGKIDRKALTTLI